jgi:ribose 5-phosphate isomerase B
MRDDEIRELVRRAVVKNLSSSESGGRPARRRQSIAPRRLVTEADLQQAAHGAEVEVPPDALLTPLARDLARERQLRLISKTPAPALRPGDTPRLANSPASASTTVAVGADHGGYELKEQLKGFIGELGFAVLDCGTGSTESVDYPDFAFAVARLVSDGQAAYGIVIDGAGIGSCMAANKVPGVRAALCYDLSTAANSREHNDANVLTLGGRLIGLNLARDIVKTWLQTEFAGGRHARRVDKITAIEQRFTKK